MNICAKNQEGKSKKFIKIYEGDHFNKIKFKAGSAKCYCLKPKAEAPTQAVNNHRSLIYPETARSPLNAFKLPRIVVFQRKVILGITVSVILGIRDNCHWNFRDKGMTKPP